MDRDASFGRLLRRLRKAHDLTQEALAQQVYCALDTIKKIEGGARRPSRQLAAQFADCFGLVGEERAAFVAAARVSAAEPATETTALVSDVAPSSQSRPGSLSAQPTLLIGREHEIASVCTLLQRPDVRLVTLTGTGGTGKTRLALQVASELAGAFRDAVWFVNLAPLSDPDLVATTIAQTLGVKELPGTTLAETLQGFLGDRQALLLLDNFEQVAVAVPLVAELLAVALGLKVLVTSRVTLHLSGEHEFPVPPLALPDPHQGTHVMVIANNPAVALFVARAHAAQPAFTLTQANAAAVVEICRRLDGLPLAIELAATRVKLLPPQALLVRLDQTLKLLTGGARDMPARQQTIRNTIEWSYNLLKPDEQALFARLGVFVGGWTLEAANAVCNADGDLPLEMLDELAALLDHSLLRQVEGAGGEPRFTMLETIREYALERLVAYEKAEMVQLRHATYYLAFVEKLESKLRGPEQLLCLNQLDIEYDNVRAVLAWALEDGDVQLGIQLAIALAGTPSEGTGFWSLRGYYREGQRWLERVGRSRSAPLAIRALACLGAGFFASLQGNYAHAVVLDEEALAYFQERGDRAGAGRALGDLGRIALDQGQYTRATDLLSESLARLRETGDLPGIADALHQLGNVVRDQGDAARAQTLLEESLAIWEDLGNTIGVSHNRMALGDIAFNAGDYLQARAEYQQALTCYQKAGYEDAIAMAVFNLGRVAHALNDDTSAAALLEESVAWYRRLGLAHGLAWTLHHLAMVVYARGDAARATALLGEALVLQQRQPNPYRVAEILECGAKLAAGEKQPEKAVRLLGAAEILRERIGAPLPFSASRAIAHTVVTTRPQINEASFTAAWAAGRALTLEQAIIEALSLTG